MLSITTLSSHAGNTVTASKIYFTFPYDTGVVQLLTDLSNVTLDVFCILPVKFYLHLTATNEQSHKHKSNWTPPGRSEVTKNDFLYSAQQSL